MVGVVLALRWFLFGGVGDDDATGGFFLGIDALDADAIVKWVELHAFLHVHHWILPKAINEVGEQKIGFKISTSKIYRRSPRLITI